MTTGRINQVSIVYARGVSPGRWPPKEPAIAQGGAIPEGRTLGCHSARAKSTPGASLGRCHPGQNCPNRIPQGAVRCPRGRSDPRGSRPPLGSMRTSGGRHQPLVTRPGGHGYELRLTPREHIRRGVASGQSSTDSGRRPRGRRRRDLCASSRGETPGLLRGGAQRALNARGRPTALRLARSPLDGQGARLWSQGRRIRDAGRHPLGESA